ncbi:protein phosphatase 1 regulatory subunit 26-like [Carassius auratus]|uniref:Protein phosphatase 1 regulatory subunit 26-like n=1 Tax=Carassius auratus TaxID=7957 RepID=A0A6P6IXV9_CARAU|nr:protein phosphatase 1 regulatory subunit 26-like [Carassius auratus]
MFLKTVPPVVAIHSEWRSNKSCILPLFFNDSASDSDLASVSGTPIPQKIQMIIESLHSTQSSDMSENMQTEKASHSSHEADYKGQMRLMDTSARSRRTGPDTKPQLGRSDTGDDSDSDDSVDRGIEEAIQEYLKEKVDHKRKGDPMASSPPAPKLQRREPTVQDAAKQHTHSTSGKVLIASNNIQRALSGTQPLKKKVKKKKLSKENPFKKADTSKVLPVKSLPPPRAKKGSSSSSEMDRSPPRLVIKEEEEWLDSSSDDGIEEEIQRFQQEKKQKQEGENDALRSSRQREHSESSSDEGIEEAIRHFQEQKDKQKKKKSPLKSVQLVPVQHIKPAVAASECMSTEPLKALSKKSKKKLITKKSNLPTPLGVSHFLNKCTSQGSKVKECAPPPSNSKQTHTEHQIHSSLKVNTAELMCAEAILDISKTVMPEVFESNLSIANRNLLQMPTFPTVAPTVDKSDESSVDSEDGIEQEIRKFLEDKAKMNKELPTTTGAPPTASGDPTTSKEPKKKKETQPNKAVRLSLSKKRKFKEEQSKLSRDSDLVLNIKEEPPGTTLNYCDSTRPELSASPTVTSHSSSLTTKKISKLKQNSPPHKGTDSSVLKDKVSTYSMSSPKTAIGSEKNDSSDKSSSLDSDEDLDAAIKDLLKTKKKVKKKVRDMKVRKSTRPSEASSLDAIKKQKPFTDLKSIPSKLVKSGILKGGKETLNIRTKNGKGHKSKAVKGRSEVPNIKESKSPAQPDKVTGNGGIPKTQDVDLPSSSLHAEDEDSSVDSDDSIEQEIRRFLAERAKESTPFTANTKQEEEAVDSLTSLPECDVNPERQKILIETPVSASASTSVRLFKSETQAESIATPARSADAPAELNKGPVLTPGSSCIMGCRRTESQKLEISTPRDPKNGSSQTDKDTPTSHTIKPNSFTTPSVSSEMPQSLGHQHQNLFLMRPVNSGMSDVKVLSAADGNDPAVNHQRLTSATRIPLKDVISSLCPSPITKPQISSCAVTTGDLLTSAPPGGRTEGLYLHNRLKRDRHLSDRPHLSPATSHLCQPSPVLHPHQGGSVIQVQRDQAAFPTPLAKTNHLQVSQIEPTESTACLGVRQREGGSVSKEEKEQEDEEEKCVDETDVESDEERKDQKTKDRKTQPHNQSLSTSIDPGFLLSPYIALDTEERSLKFQTRRLRIQKQLEESKTVKRRLQFVINLTR